MFQFGKGFLVFSILCFNSGRGLLVFSILCFKLSRKLLVFSILCFNSGRELLIFSILCFDSGRGHLFILFMIYLRTYFCFFKIRKINFKIILAWSVNIWLVSNLVDSA